MNILKDEELLGRAVGGLRRSLQTQQKNEKDLRQLFSTANGDLKEKVHLLVSLVKIPSIPIDGKVKTFTIRSQIPNNFVDETSNVLLITKNLKGFAGPKSDHQKSVDAFTKLLQEHKAYDLITEVMPISKLKYDYLDFESKRKLCKRVDVVLCDVNVLFSAYKLLGKEFYKSKKIPIGVNLKVSNLKKEIRRALSSSYLHMGLSGNCARAQVGKLEQTDEQIAANILATIGKWSNKIPGGWKNVRSVCLKTDRSSSIPLFRSTTLGKDFGKVKHPLQWVDETVATGSITTQHEDVTVRVKRSSTVLVLKSKNKKAK